MFDSSSMQFPLAIRVLIAQRSAENLLYRDPDGEFEGITAPSFTLSA